MVNRHCKNLLLISSILVTGVSNANLNTISDGFYISGGFGKSIIKDIKKSSLPIVSTVNILMTESNNLSLSYQRGTNFRGAIGYKICDLRYEIEATHILARYKDLTMNHGENSLFTPLLSGKTRIISAMANFYYDFSQLSNYVVPYIGTGLGLAQVKNHIEFELMDGKDIGNITEHGFSYQAIGGLMLNMTKQISAFLDYRCFATTKLKALNEPFQNHSINFGLLYRF